MVGEHWNKKVIGIPVDGAASMVGYVSGAIERLCPSVVYHVCCESHQLVLAVQDAFVTKVRDLFQQPLIALIFYLRRQTNLNASTGSTCPKPATNRLLSVGNIC